MLVMTETELHPHAGDWLQDVVFGLNDGVVTTLVFILAVSSLAASKIVLVAVGEVVAGAISMTLGGFLSWRTEGELLERRVVTEREEIRQEPEEERAELFEIYKAKGLAGDLLVRVVDHLTSDEERWLEAMMHDEHGVTEGKRQSPLTRGAIVGGAFVVGGLVPVIPFAAHVSDPKVIAVALTAAVALALGALKSLYTVNGPLRGAVEFLAIVAAGTLVGVAIGSLLHHL
jgi:vacuolar iron transporter family protein